MEANLEGLRAATRLGDGGVRVLTHEPRPERAAALKELRVWIPRPLPDPEVRVPLTP